MVSVMVVVRRVNYGAWGNDYCEPGVGDDVHASNGSENDNAALGNGNGSRNLTSFP